MRYAIFTDIHANLEALEAVLAKIDEIAEEKPIDEIWFLGDLVGYGPDPNACISIIRERTEVIIAGNHDWAAVGKIDLEEFSAAARISAEWTAEQLTDEHREFLADLPERLEKGECTLVHGSPFGPLWEYLTSEVLAERSFQYFDTRCCFIGHTHLPTIFQQPEPAIDDFETIANTPTIPLGDEELAALKSAAVELNELDAEDSEAASPDGGSEMTLAQAALTLNANTSASRAESAYADPDTGQPLSEGQANTVHEEAHALAQEEAAEEEPATVKAEPEPGSEEDSDEEAEALTSEQEISDAEDRINGEIEELLALLGLSQSMVEVTNQMLTPPEGLWVPPAGYRVIVNPGGVGQPRDGDPRAAFMIYDTEEGIEFYRVPYDIEKTQEKIIQAGLPQYLAIRLAHGR